MKILLDTQAFLWLISDSEELSKKAKNIFLDLDNQLFLSLASIWEIAIKNSIGKLSFKKPVEEFIAEQLQINNISCLEIGFRHVIRTANLPFHHRDPFDRLLISQAIEEKIPIVTSDKAFDKYAIKRIW